MSKEKLFQLAYDPKEDITVWELAQVIALNMELDKLNHPIPQCAIDTLNPTIRRHYREEDVTEKYLGLLENSKNKKQGV